MTIPKSFTLGPYEIKVIIEDVVLKEKNQWGEARIGEKEIWLSKDLIDSNSIPETTKLKVFYHEKVHFILDIMSEDKLRDDEKFVDLFANLLLQTDLTQII